MQAKGKKSEIIDFVRLKALLDASLEDKWVAIAPDYTDVVAVADTLQELMEIADDRNIFYLVPSPQRKLSEDQLKEVRRRRAERDPKTLSVDEFDGRLRRFGV
jgi:hypothetical protein